MTRQALACPNRIHNIVRADETSAYAVWRLHSATETDIGAVASARGIFGLDDIKRRAGGFEMRTARTFVLAERQSSNA
jgi:hypothetical protein